MYIALAPPTGLDRTPATPSPGSPIPPYLFDNVFAKIMAYNESPSSVDYSLNLEYMNLTSVVYGILPPNLKELYVAGNPLLEIDCAHLPKTLEVLDVKNCKYLERILNLDQLPNLLCLKAQSTPIRSLSRLPPRLEQLRIDWCTKLTRLPSLSQSDLTLLSMDYSGVTFIPQFPETLCYLFAGHSQLSGDFPVIPESLIWLDVLGTPAVNEGFLPEIPDTVTVHEYTQTTRTWWNACLRRERYEAIHEELMAATWHPRRVEAWLSAGEEVLDMMMGC
jgi:hypothetical protein